MGIGVSRKRKEGDAEVLDKVRDEGSKTDQMSTERNPICLNDLPDDILLCIIPSLGLRDRTLLSSTCRRLYKLESKAGVSTAIEQFGELDADSESIVLHRYKHPVDRGKYCGDRGLEHNLNNVTALETVFALLHRIYRVSPGIMKLSVTMDFNEHNEVMDLIAAIGARWIRITHLNSEFPLTITSDFIASISSSTSSLDIENARFNPSDIQLMYEIVKESSLQYFNIRLSFDDAANFAQQIMGVNLSLFKNAEFSQMTTSKENIEVYFIEKSLKILVMRDSQKWKSEIWCFKRDGIELADITISKNNYAGIYNGMRRIPFVAP